MIVVTNSGPLMALAKLGLLDLLGQLYGKAYMPGAVYDEVVCEGRRVDFPIHFRSNWKSRGGI